MVVFVTYGWYSSDKRAQESDDGDEKLHSGNPIGLMDLINREIVETK